MQSINYRSAADNTRQPMMFYKPQVDAPRPLLVALHSSSNNYRQKESVIYAEWCMANECRKRSPVTYLERARGVSIDINHDIRDGRNNGDPVPISQSLFRRQSGNARITVFDGAHDKNTEAAFRWLNRQRKSR